MRTASRGWTLYGVLVAALFAAVPAAQQTPPETPFQFERPVQTGGAGARRLAVDVALLAGSQSRQRRPSPAPALSDLRLFDSGGQEVPYLLVANPPEAPVWRSAATLAIPVVETPTQKLSGFEVDLGEPITVDRFKVEGVPGPFLKRVRLEGSGDRARWTQLVAEGTLFLLPDEGLAQNELAFTPGPYRYIRLIWDDSRSGRVDKPPTASVRVVRNVIPPPPLTTPLVFERRPSEPGHSQFRVRLPATRLPIIALDIDIAGRYVLRNATVYEASLVGGEVVPRPIGTATLSRVERDDLTASSMRIPIRPVAEPQLTLDIDDANNPPSDVRSVTAIFAELPWIYFESPGDTVIARYGNPSLQAPRYDLEAARTSLAIDTTADAAWGEARTRTAAENAGSPPPSLPTVGSSLDAALFKYARPIPPGEAGLITVPLDEHVLAHGRAAAFGDVRVLDSQDRQVPYLVERVSEPLSLDVTLDRLDAPPATVQSGRTQSAYRVRLPLENLPVPRLVLTTSARVFTRRVTVGVDHPPERRRRDPWFETFTSMSWAHSDQETAAPSLTIPLPQMNTRDVIVIVDEGDNSALPLTSARILLPAYRLRLFRERDATLRLAYGRDDLTPPRYDLALLAPQLTGAAATDVVAAAEQAAPPSAATVLMSPAIFWGVLVAAVLVLLTLVARLMRRADVQSTTTP
jgi:hypothetical protein